jgi:hypothetical protein
MIVKPGKMCSDPKNFIIGSDDVLGNEFSWDSKCFESTVIKTGVTSASKHRCHRFVCDATN